MRGGKEVALSRWLGSVFCVFIAAPALAGPLSFGAINGVDDLSRDAAIGRCASDGATCALTRTSFGGLPVRRSTVSLNSSGRVRAVEIILDDKNYALARQLIAGRYGDPIDSRGSARWTAFDDGAGIAMRRTGTDTAIAFDFPANAASAAVADTNPAWAFLLLAGIGVAAGFGAYRWNGGGRRAPARPGREMSMRETLERRLQRGDELSF